ncbi:hypothetical protein EVG20_g7432 [Dentipellis fragilis]|uniref:Uncharacterized protein n=1 Tax=Dentipellis fragilis TaxID=205917 RepID=A0A4Y9YFB3_9AGAM|nr:hypothetical protein EVG20_g7432 [Dentipellis fragilis]
MDEGYNHRIRIAIEGIKRGEYLTSEINQRWWRMAAEATEEASKQKEMRELVDRGDELRTNYIPNHDDLRTIYRPDGSILNRLQRVPCPCSIMTRIVGGYLLNPNDLEEFIRKLVNDDVSFEEDYDDTAAQYRLLVQWLKRLPQEERIAAVQSIRTTKVDMVVCVITGIAEHHSSRARILETDKQRKARDRFIEKLNATIDSAVLSAERMEYFSFDASYLAGPVGDCYFDYQKWLALERQKDEEAAADAKAEALIQQSSETTTNASATT